MGGDGVGAAGRIESFAAAYWCMIYLTAKYHEEGSLSLLEVPQIRS